MGDQLLEFIRSLKNKDIGLLDEAATKQTIILRCLSVLDWDMFNRDEVYPEYSVGPDSTTKRVDFSLRVKNTNTVFIEVKKPSEELEKHQEQLLNYAFQQGVRFAILTNGSTWWFYLPLHEGNWEQRKFYSIDIYQQEAGDIASKFTDFLSRENIANGKAFDNAEAVYKSQQKQKILHDTLPKAWNTIISEPDGLLVDLINETAESICGFRAGDDVIRRFLARHREQLLVIAIPEPEPAICPVLRPPSSGPVSTSESYTGKQISFFHFKGRKYEVHSWKNLLTELCVIMNTNHRTDFGKVLELKGRKNPHFTRDKSMLIQPGAIPGTDIFVETCLNANQTVRFCRRVMDLFGYPDEDLKIELRSD